MHKILDEYIERDIVETSTSSWNSQAFFIKKQHRPEETPASKRLRVVQVNCQLNTTIIDEVFVTWCVQELVETIGNNNKYYV
jgi:hypothetical protein